MIAISLWQPWATLIAIGAKRFETRGWNWDYTGPIAIHAAKHWSKEIERMCWEYEKPFAQILKKAGFLPYNDHAGLPMGAIVCLCTKGPTAMSGGYHKLGKVYLSDGTIIKRPELDFGDYSAGRRIFPLSNVLKLPEPIPFKGRQRLFNVPDELLNKALGLKG